MRERWWLGLVGVIALAAGVVWISRSSTAERSAAPFRVVVSEPKADCLEGTALPSDISGLRMKEEGPPRNWSRIERAPGAMQGGRAAVEVTIRPRRMGERVTLAGIDFDVVPLSTRPIGITFYRPCKVHLRGAAIQADLDMPTHVDDSSAALDGALEPGPHLPANRQPIRFPWTLNLNKPVHLFVVVHSEYTYCLWDARIRWRSGEGSGTIRVDDNGRKYRLDQSMISWWERPVDGQWLRTLQPDWTGVR